MARQFIDAGSELQHQIGYSDGDVVVVLDGDLPVHNQARTDSYIQVQEYEEYLQYQKVRMFDINFFVSSCLSVC